MAPVLAAAALTACGPTPSEGAASTGTSTTLSATTTSSTAVAPATTTTTAAADPGLLPQTPAEPPVDGTLQAALTPLWSALVSGSQAAALGSFFPRAAYLQMKTGVLPDPASDYTNRLIAFYDLDLAVYHAALGGGAPAATLVSLDASPSDASWIPPGSCENTIGYWHLPGVRMVYQDGSAVRSFAIASLISWRGVWYVVHLGPNPRPSNLGTVDQPATGPGTPGPPGGC